jgi:hypothetical protein
MHKLLKTLDPGGIRAWEIEQRLFVADRNRKIIWLKSAERSPKGLYVRYFVGHRMKRLGKFSPNEQLFTLVNFSKISNAAPSFGLIFSTAQVVYTFGQEWIRAIFFTN